MFHVPEQYRIRKGAFASTEADGNNGMFEIPVISAKANYVLRIIASDGLGWEHVSVSTGCHIPTWAEMCIVKKKFWDAEDCVVQYHPPESEYVNNCQNCLHLWRPYWKELPRPASYLVGIKPLLGAAS